MSNGKMFEESFARANISANKNAERSATMSIIIIRGAAKTHSHTDIHTHIDYAEKAINSVFFLFLCCLPMRNSFIYYYHHCY